MKKKALNKDLFREIRNTRSRFLSIFLLVALAVAFLSGLRTTSPDMKKTADDYLDAQNLMDLRIVSTLGLTEADVEALASYNGVAQAEGAWSLDATADPGTSDQIVKVLSLEEELNLPYLVEGRLPEAANECVTETRLLNELGKSIGDTITLDTGDEQQLTETEFTVVGVVYSPLYISIQRGSSTMGNGRVSAFVMVPDEAVDLDYYTDCYVTLEGTKELNAFSDTYEDLVADVQDGMEPFAEERSQLRTDTLRSDAQAELDDAKQTYEDKKAETEQELADAKQELDDARNELDDGWNELEDSRQELEAQVADAQKEIDDGEASLADAYATLTQGESDYQDGKAQLASAQSQYNSGKATYDAGLAEYNSGYAQYQEGLAQYQAGEAQYQEGLAQYQAGETQYQEGLAQYQAGEAQYQEGLAQYQAGLSQWQTAWAQITAAGMEDSDTGLALQAQKAQLDEAKAQLDSTAAQLDTSKSTLDATAAQLAESKAALDATADQLAESKATLDATATQLSQAKAQLDSSKTQLDSAKAQIDTAQAKLTASRKELDSGWSDYNSGQSTLASSKQQLEEGYIDGLAQLEEAEQTLNDGETEYADGLQAYQDGKAEADEQLQEAFDKLQDAQSQIDDIEDCTWYVLDRSTNLGFAGYRQDAEHMAKLGQVFPLIFFLVAALVCLTTMTRMVEDQRVQIGCLKALGYTRRDISRKYLGYGLIASLAGSVVGLAVGCTSLPLVIMVCWKILYMIPGLAFAFCPGIYLASAVAAVGVITAAVLAATLNALRETPATLMRPRTPKAGKRVLLERITPLWKRLSFSHKVTIRNLFRYQKRFWMTVIGIGGCTALLIAGFGLKDSIMDILGLQYGQLHNYHITVALKSDHEDALNTLLADQQADGIVSDWRSFTEGAMEFQGNGTTVSGYYVVTDTPDELEGFVELRTRKGHHPVELTDEGVVISDKLSEMLGVEIGDTIVLSGDTQVKATITGIVENYVYHYVYMTRSYYQSLYGTVPDHNATFVMLTEDTDENNSLVCAALLEADCATSASGVRDSYEAIQKSFDTINIAVLIIILSAAALAFVVLYNLTNINITERLRELATLKVLGFRDKEMNAYVFRENVILTVIGAALGLLMGKWLHQYLIRSVEVEMVEFGRSVSATSYLWSVLLTICFGILVNQAAKLRLRKIDMVESLKTID